MTIEAQITQKINLSMQPVHLEVTNESYMHNVPKGSESHFKLLVVAQDFQSQNRVQRHRAINALLAEELQGPIHALSMHLFSPEEWETSKKHDWASPKCHGGSKD